MLYDILISALALIFCLVIPVGLMVALIVWAARSGSRRRQRAILPSERRDLLSELEMLIEQWTIAGRLSAGVAAQVRAVLQQERAKLSPQPARTPSASAPPEPGPQPDTSLPLPPGIPAAAVSAPTANAAPSAIPAATTAAPASSPPSSAPSQKGRSLWVGLLALRTRMTLLFLGAFLLLMSSLILVVFNWASFPPILQFGLLAGVCGAFWAGGGWVARREGLRTAGMSLQAVGGVLVPVVGFAFTRPGLLPFAVSVSYGWLFASVLSVAVYVVAAMRLKHLLFVVAGCLAGVSSTLALFNVLEVADGWWGPGLALLFSGYLVLAQRIPHARLPYGARALQIAAHSGVPGMLLLILAGVSTGAVVEAALAWTLWASVGFYLLATWLSHTPHWLWGTVGGAPLALATSLSAFDITLEWWGLALGLLTVVGLGLALALERPARAYALPYYVGSAMLFVITLPGVVLNVLDGNPFAAAWTLPVLLAWGAGLPVAYHLGRWGWLHEQERLSIATVGLLAAGTIVPFWVSALLQLGNVGTAHQGLVLLGLAIMYVVAARWWPGRIHRVYDVVLQGLTVLLACTAGLLTLYDERVWLVGMLMLTAVWGLQAFIRRGVLWAVLTLGNLQVAALLHLLHIEADITIWIVTGLVYTCGYMLVGTQAHLTRWRYWVWPGIGWGAAASLLTLLGILIAIGDAERILPAHMAYMGVLLGLGVWLTWRWQQPWIGYPTAVLGVVSVLLAGVEGFFTPWEPALEEMSFIICGLALAIFLGSQFSRRRFRASYAIPYELTGYLLLLLAPLPAMSSPAHATLTWASMTLLYGLATWRYRLPWVLALAFLSLDMALLRGAGWRFPGGDPAGGGVILLVATWLQAFVGMGARYLERSQPDRPPEKRHSLASYTVALLSGAGAIVLASGSIPTFTSVVVGLTLLAALVATVERSEWAAWGTLALLAVAVGSLGETLDLLVYWTISWGVFVALMLTLVGWGLDMLGQRMPGVAAYTAPWQRPLMYGPLGASSLLTIMLLPLLGSAEALALTFALANLGVLQATLAVWRREITYAYLSGAALVGAGLSQLASWGLSNPQWYVVPSGLYLLALAEGLRRFQQQRQASQVVEAGGLLLLLGTTLVQSFRAEGLLSMFYAIVVCGESLLVLGYGTLRKLRVPFLGGTAFFVLGIIWLSVDPLRAANKWILLGVLGIILVAVYVVLEQRQEQLTRVGRQWVERLQGWS